MSINKTNIDINALQDGHLKSSAAVHGYKKEFNVFIKKFHTHFRKIYLKNPDFIKKTLATKESQTEFLKTIYADLVKKGKAPNKDIIKLIGKITLKMVESFKLEATLNNVMSTELQTSLCVKTKPILMSLCRDYESVLNQKTDVILASKDPHIELIFNPKEIQIRRNAKIAEKFRLDYQTNQITYNDAPITTIQSILIPKFFELIQQLMTEGKMELLNDQY